MIYPSCYSNLTIERKLGQKTFSLIISLRFAARSISGAMVGSAANASFKTLLNPAGIANHGVTGFILDVLAGAAPRCIAGAIIDEQLHKNFLNNCLCQNCGHRFILTE